MLNQDELTWWRLLEVEPFFLLYFDEFSLYYKASQLVCRYSNEINCRVSGFMENKVLRRSLAELRRNSKLSLEQDDRR